MKTPKVLIMTGYGINSDLELAHIFEMAGAKAYRVHINDLIHGKSKIADFDILAFPGGFSFGDHIASGRVYANKLRVFLKKELLIARDRGIPMIGICNGFQVLVKMGLLPGTEGDELNQTASLVRNDSGKFEDRWCPLKADSSSVCIWTKGMDQVELPVRHGEGKFVTSSPEELKRLQSSGQICLRYTAKDGSKAEYPDNPNGSEDDIAGICDSTGRIFGLMPHPEVYMHATNHPRWTRLGLSGEGEGVPFFRNAVEFLQKES